MIIEFILLQVAISQKCTTFNNDTFEIYATQNEIIKMSFSEIFLEKDYSNITIENGLGLLSITQPISQLELKQFDSINMKSFSLLTNELSYEWLNKFAALIYTNNQYIIQLSQQNNQGQNGRMPDFSTTSQPINVDVCFDAVFVSKSIIAVDCMNTETNGGIQNIYYLWNDIHKNFTPVENDNFKGYTKDIKRKSLAAYQQIYRASIYNVDHSEYDSVLEVFSSDGKLSHFLDSDYLTNLLSFQYQLQILDFRVSNLGQVAILNNNNDILVLNYSVREKVWKLLHRFEHNGQVKAFDFNFKVGTYLVYYDNFLLYQSKTNQFQFQISNITSVYLTNQRILAQNNDQIFLLDQILNLIQTQQIESINFIINDHTKDDLLIFNKQKIIRYYLYEDYYLTYQNFDTDSVEQFSYIQQTLPNQIVCQFQLIHSTVSTHNEVLFVSQKNGNIIDEFIPTYPSNYSLKFNKHSVYGTNLQYQFSQIKNKGEMLDITPKSFEKYNIQFHSTDKQSFIYLLDSESDIYLIIQYESYLMEIQICSKQLECKVELQTMIDFQLNEQNSCFWVGSKALFIAFYYENIISVNYLKNSALNQLFEIPYEFEVDRLLYNGIFLIFSKSEMIITAYYISTVGYLKQYTLNSQSISDLGIKDWQPNKVFSVHSNNHIYILNKETDLIIISCTLLEYKILDRINFSQPIENVLAFTKSFIVSFNTELHVYDTNNEADFHYSKIIPLFGYQIQKIVSQTVQGWIYIVTNQQQLLIININNLNVNSLLNVIPINNINLISATQDYVFVDNCILKQYHKVNLISNAEIYSTNLLNKIDLQVQISNPKSQYFAHFNQTIQNQQTSIRLDESKLTLQKTLDQKSQENYCQQLSNDFFQNTVNKLEIQCPDCGKEIELKENIQFINSIENGLDFNSIGNDRLIILNAQNFLIFSINQQLIMNISFVDQNVNCSKIMYADESIILLKCADDFLIQWKYNNDKYILEQKLESQPDLSSVQLIDNALFLISPHIVELYQNNTKIEKWEIDGRVLKIHKINSFFHIYYQDSQISIIEFQIISGVVLETQTLVIDLNQLFIDYQFNHHWLNLYIQDQSENKNLFNADYLLVAEAGVHFVFNFLFNCTNLCKLEQSTINNIIQNYGDWVAQDSKNQDNWFGVLYQKEEQQTLSIYQIPSSWNNQNAVTQIGALTLRELSQFNFINQNNQVILGTINNGTLSFFSLNKQRQLCMNGKIEKQSVLLIASNDFSQQQYTFQIDIKYNYYKFWGLWLFIAVILIGLGIGIWCWKKRKNAKKDLLLLG